MVPGKTSAWIFVLITYSNLFFISGSIANRKDRLDLNDILTAIEKTKPVSKNLTKRHVEWQNEMGCS